MKKRSSTKTPVIFRKDPDGTVFAIFPADLADCRRHVTVYQHVGQHSAGDYAGMMRDSKPARQGEYANLARELRSLSPSGYHLQIVQRRTKTHVAQLDKQYAASCRR